MIKKDIFIKFVSFLSAATMVAVGFVIKENKRGNYYLNIIENQYSRAFEQLNSSLNNISIAMQKTVYVSSAKKMGALAAEIFSEAELAKTALSELPTGGENLSAVYRFLSQVGNFSLSVAKSITSENEISQKQRDELKMLSDTAKTVSEIINDAGIEYNTPDEWARLVSGRLNEAIDKGSFAASLTELEENLSDYPTLIYDGPYSDHILEKMPLMTASGREFSQEEALNAAVKAAKTQNLKFSDMQKGKIEAYRFAGDDATVTVSKNGGYIVYMRKGRAVTEQKISYKDAVSHAKAYLEELQIKNMQDTYYYTDNGICVINFAYVEGRTICYTDLIKVGVAMDTGEIMLLETVGYLTNHTARTFKTLQNTKEQAAEKISSDLEIEKSEIALIPTDAGGEVRCYEFLCRTQDNQDVLIYINANTLEEEQIYILLKSDGGTLVK